MKDFKLRIGSRAQVMHGTAKMTSGGLKKKDLKYNKRGKIVSRKASRTAKKANKLVKAGYITKKGVFGVVRKGGGNNANIPTATNLNKRYNLPNAGVAIPMNKYNSRMQNESNAVLAEPIKNENNSSRVKLKIPRYEGPIKKLAIKAYPYVNELIIICPDSKNIEHKNWCH